MIQGKKERAKRKKDAAEQEEEEERREQEEEELIKNLEESGVLKDLENNELRGVKNYIKTTIQSGYVALKEFRNDIKKDIEQVKISKKDVIDLCDSIIKDKDKILKNYEIKITLYEKDSNKLAIYSEIFKEIKTNSRKILDTNTAKHAKNIIGDIKFTKNKLDISISEKGNYTDKEKTQNFDIIFNAIKKNVDNILKQQDSFYQTLGEDTESTTFKESVVGLLQNSLDSIKKATKIDKRKTIWKRVEKEFDDAIEFVRINSIDDIAAKYGIKY